MCAHIWNHLYLNNKCILKIAISAPSMKTHLYEQGNLRRIITNCNLVSCFGNQTVSQLETVEKLQKQ